MTTRGEEGGGEGEGVEVGFPLHAMSRPRTLKAQTGCAGLGLGFATPSLSLPVCGLRVQHAAQVLFYPLSFSSKPPMIGALMSRYFRFAYMYTNTPRSINIQMPISDSHYQKRVGNRAVDLDESQHIRQQPSCHQTTPDEINRSMAILQTKQNACHRQG